MAKVFSYLQSNLIHRQTFLVNNSMNRVVLGATAHVLGYEKQHLSPSDPAHVCYVNTCRERDHCALLNTQLIATLPW